MELRALTFDEFPELLKEIPDHPKKLYIEGAPIPEDLVRISVVGSRKYSDYGKRVTEKLLRDLHGFNVAIVSGCALGIDSIAHQAAIKNNLYTIGIPGSGLDKSVFYPRSNYFLKEAILRSGGSLISELEPKAKAEKWTFPRRNRIMAGISHAVLVIEATPKSGTLITARLGLEYNRDVLAVPGSIFSNSSEGANQLIKDGASPVLNAQDIIDELKLEKREAYRGEEVEKKTPTQNKVIDTRSEESVLSLFDEQISRDELVDLIGDIKKAQILITKLELRGKIRSRDSKIYKT